MDFQRVVLYSALMFVVLSLWNAWQKDYPPAKAAAPQAQTQNYVATPSALSQSGPSASQPAPASTAPETKRATSANLIEVKTDVLKVSIDPQGGNIVKAVLPHYPESVDQPNSPIVLLDDSENKLYVAQSGLLSATGPDTQQGQALLAAEKNSYELAPNENTLKVPLRWRNAQGVDVVKTFIFKRNDYSIGINYQIVNHSAQSWSGQLYTQLVQKKPPSTNGGLFNISSYTGGAVSTPSKRYQKVSFDQMAKQDLNQTTQNGWMAMQQHYFLSAWVPNPSESFNYYTHAMNGDVYVLGAVGPQITIAPNQTATTAATLYAGPELMDQLRSLAPGLDLTIDYGWLWFISIAIFWLLKQIHQIVGNWGWAIVLVTVFIKLCFYKLSASSYKSMAGMRKMQPKIEALKERYAQDKQKLSQAMMELYKKEKINPLGGCLPILVQIPVFIALYWVLLESVELRQAPFILWIKDLSVKDPYHILPGIMGVTMFLQQKLSPAPADPVQAKVMLAMPIVMTALFWNFPAGLVLYWAVNNTLSIAQQWYVMKKFS